MSRLADGTKAGYRRTLDYIRDKAGHRDVRRLKRRDIIAAQEANSDTPKKANEIVKLFSILLKHALDLDWIDANPAEKIAKLPECEGHEPWPVWAIAACRAKAKGLAWLTFELCLASGQRIGDVIRFRWSDLDGHAVTVKQAKTGAELWIPRPRHLIERLDGVEKRGLTILTNEKGQPASYWTAHRRVMETRKAAGCAAYAIHGLRKNATIELLERGCTDAEAMAITGHSTRAMLLKYGAEVGQRKLAESAAAKRWNRTEPKRETAKLSAKPKNGGKS